MTGFQLSSVLGPALGGLLIAVTHGTAVVYLLAAVATITYAAMMLTLSGVPRPEQSSGVTLQSLVAGFSFVWHHPIILPALALDLFAVLLGGATSLLPIFAKDILNVGATGLGLARCGTGGRCHGDGDWSSPIARRYGMPAVICCGRWPDLDWRPWHSACRRISSSRC